MSSQGTEQSTTDSNDRRPDADLHDLFDNMSDMVICVRPDGKIDWFNRALPETLGYPEVELDDSSVFELLAPGQVAWCQRLFQRVLDGEKTVGIETTFRSGNGDEIHVEGRCHCHRDDSGTATLVFGVFRDVTEAKRLADELRLSDERHRGFVENSSEGIYLCEFDTPLPVDLPEDEQILRLPTDCFFAVCNDAFARMYSYESGQQMIGMRAIDLYRTHDNEANTEFMRLMVRNRYRVSGQISEEFDADGNRRVFSNNCLGIVEDGHLQRVWGTQRDITEQVQAEEALRESEARYADLYEYSPDMMCSVDARTAMITACNQTLADALGCSKDEIVGRPVFDVYDPDCLDRVRDAFQSFVETGNVRNAELQLRRKDGSTIDVSLNVSATRDESGNVVSSRSVWRDVTDWRRMEKAVRDSEEKFSRAFSSSPIPLIITTMEMQFVEANEAFCTLFQFKRTELIGRTPMELGMIDDSQREAVLAGLQQAGGAIRNAEIQAHVADGSVHEILYSTDTIHFQGNPHLLSTLIDVTLRKRLEEQTREAAIARARCEMLSPREQETLQHVAAGLTNKVIARRMSISEKTVEKHRSSLMRKLKVQSVAELVRLAMLNESADLVDAAESPVQR